MKKITLMIMCFTCILFSCAPIDTEPEPDAVFSVEEDGQPVFYSSSDKAFGDIYLGMPRYMIDTISISSPEVTISGRQYETVLEYSKTGMLSSFYIKTDSIDNNDEVNKVVDEIEDVIGVKYGPLDMTFVSELPSLGIAKHTLVDSHEVYWGAHWNEGSKYIALGVEPIDSANKAVWVWIFNTNLWTKLGEDKVKQEANNF
jgi:hypothetical protein